MTETIPYGFESFSKKTIEYNSHIITLFSGIVIGFLINYFVTFMIPLPYWYGLGICLSLITVSIYFFLLYSPNASIGKAEEIVPEALHKFLHSYFNKFLTYVQLDWQDYAFHNKAISADGWQAPVRGVVVRTKQISSHQGDIKLEYPFLKIFKCKFEVKIFITSLTKIPEYRKVLITIRVNSLAKIHPKTNLVLKTLGVRLHHAINNPQIVYPNIPEKEWHSILKEIRPSVYKAYVDKKSKTSEN